MKIGILDLQGSVKEHYDALKKFPDDVKRRIWLVHYKDGDLPDAKADGFAGFVKCGQVFE